MLPLSKKGFDEENSYNYSTHVAFDTIPKDLRPFLYSLLDDRSILSLSSTCRRWQARVKADFTKKIVSFFGRMFPLPIAVRLWVPPSAEPATQFVAESPPKSRKLDLHKLISKGTIDEIRENISSIKDRSQFTVYPLISAVKAERFDAVRLLVESGFPLEVIVDGKTGVLDNPLYCSTFGKSLSITHYLLQKGALLNIGVKGEDGKKIFHRCIRELSCTALVVRSWMKETGLKTLENDEYLPKIAGRRLKKGQWEIAALLISYGVKPKIRRTAVVSRLRNGYKDTLEFMRSKGLLNYQTFVHKKHSLSDLADRYGQFELEDFFVKQHKVPYLKIARNHDHLQKTIFVGLEDCFKFKNVRIPPTHPNNWMRRLEIIDHYKLRVSDKDNLGHTGIDILFLLLGNPRRVKKNVLQAIQDLIDRGATLTPDQSAARELAAP